MRVKMIWLGCIISGLLLLGVSWPLGSSLWVIYFEDGTTVEEAAIALGAIDGLEYHSPFRWSIGEGAIGRQSGVSYDPAADELSVMRGEVWFTYYDVVGMSTKSLRERIENEGVSSSAAQKSRYDEMTTGMAMLDQTVKDCWFSGDCPVVPVHRVEVYASNDQADLLKGLDVVLKMEQMDSELFFFSG
ncbi:MAG: hypothetical protein AAF702_14040 [Chloroflexota bacterium]